MTTDLCFKCSNEDSILCMICGIAKDGAREHFKPKPITNADRIRAMTDEELAEWLDSISMDWYNEGYTKETPEPQMSAYPATASEWLDWLKQEVEK